MHDTPAKLEMSSQTQRGQTMPRSHPLDLEEEDATICLKRSVEYTTSLPRHKIQKGFCEFKKTGIILQ